MANAETSNVKEIDAAAVKKVEEELKKLAKKNDMNEYIETTNEPEKQFNIICSYGPYMNRGIWHHNKDRINENLSERLKSWGLNIQLKYDPTETTWDKHGDIIISSADGIQVGTKRTMVEKWIEVEVCEKKENPVVENRGDDIQIQEAAPNAGGDDLQIQRVGAVDEIQIDEVHQIIVAEAAEPNAAEENAEPNAAENNVEADGDAAENNDAELVGDAAENNEEPNGGGAEPNAGAADNNEEEVKEKPKKTEKKLIEEEVIEPVDDYVLECYLHNRNYPKMYDNACAAGRAIVEAFRSWKTKQNELGGVNGDKRGLEKIKTPPPPTSMESDSDGLEDESDSLE